MTWSLNQSGSNSILIGNGSDILIFLNNVDLYYSDTGLIRSWLLFRIESDIKKSYLKLSTFREHWSWINSVNCIFSSSSRWATRLFSELKSRLIYRQMDNAFAEIKHPEAGSRSRDPLAPAEIRAKSQTSSSYG